jgi:hypothetical protein
MCLRDGFHWALGEKYENFVSEKQLQARFAAIKIVQREGYLADLVQTRPLWLPAAQAVGLH